MKKIFIGTFAFLLLVGSFLAGSWYNHSRVTQGDAVPVRKILYYIDPMHPSYKSDKPGIAPDCGMELVPVYEDGSMGGPGGRRSGSASGAVQINAEKQQFIGVKVQAVEKRPFSHSLRILGRVVVDERRIYVINSAATGWVREISSVTVGDVVRKGQKLATFYSPEFLSAQQAYFYALNALDRFMQQDPPNQAQIKLTKANIQQYSDTLRSLGMGERQIEEIGQTRTLTDQIELASPTSGIIIARNLYPGQRFERATEFYRISDLNRVWILADTYENEGRYFTPGVRVPVHSPNLKGTFFAAVSDVPPLFDPSSRTLRVRLEAENPGQVLRPDMFVDIELPVTLPPAITVPVDAVVDSGVKKTVYVDKGNGVFEPRRVETGWRMGDRVEIVKGLMPGEKIVVSGTFLIDSESRMKAAAAGISGETSEDPVCGMDVDQSKARAAGRTAAIKGQTYYFCSDECKVSFEKEPARYTAKAGSGQGELAGSGQQAAGSKRGEVGSRRASSGGQGEAGSGQEELTGSGQQAAGSKRGEVGSRRASSGGGKLEGPHAGHEHPPGAKR